MGLKGSGSDIYPCVSMQAEVCYFGISTMILCYIICAMYVINAMLCVEYEVCHFYIDNNNVLCTSITFMHVNRLHDFIIPSVRLTSISAMPLMSGE